MGRGPSYPFIDLEEAIASTQKIYEYTKRATAPTDSVVQTALGYSLKSSGGQKTIAALRSYGLIEESNETVKITDRAYRILMDHHDSPERTQAIKEAALSPKWYQTAFQEWGADPPASTRSTLILQHGFVPTTVDGFLKDYRKTVQFAGLEGADGAQDQSKKDGPAAKSYIPKIGDYVQWETQGNLRLPEAKKLVRVDSGYAFLEGSSNGVPVGELIPAEAPESKPPFVPQNIFVPAVIGLGAKGETKMQTETFALPDGVTGQLQWPSVISADALADFLYQLEGVKRKVERAARAGKAAELQSSDDAPAKENLD